MIEQLFFELIRVATGMQNTLSRALSTIEWKQLYDMAKKQSLVGICFVSIQRLPSEMRPPKMLYHTWLGMAAKIQYRNDVVNRQCIELQTKLTADGFRSCILKGQGIAFSYPDNLRTLRQCGDIDVWVDSNKEEIIDYVMPIIKTL